MQAIILAGGLGTRLRSVVEGVPKPMVLIQSQPFLAILFKYLASQGITNVVISVGYLHDQIMHYFGDRYASATIQYSVETEPLGTGGAIMRALPLAQNKPILVLNGDTFFKVNYQSMMDMHRSENSCMTMALKPVTDSSRYGIVEIKDGEVVAFREKQQSGSGLINTGAYIIEPDIFSGHNLPEAFSFERDFLYPQVPLLKPKAFVSEGYFIDIGVPEDYLRAQSELQDNVS